MVKKYALIIFALHCTAMSNAQQLTANSNGQNVEVIRNAQNIIWDQPIASNGNGIVSNYFNLIPGGTYAADDFQLTEQTKIESITVHGFQNAGTLESILTGLDLYIYEDTSGMPSSDPGTIGSGVFELIDLPVSDPALTVTPFDLDGYTFTIDITAVNGGDFFLNTGTYWLVLAPRINRDDIDFSYRWHWYSAGESIVLSEPMLIDPDDVFLQVPPNWTGLSNLGISFQSLAFTIEGEDNLGNGQLSLSQISIYPNPAKNFIKVKSPSNVQIEGVKLLDVLGKDMNVTYRNDAIDIAHLAKGIYLMKIQSSVGETVKRIVKN